MREWPTRSSPTSVDAATYACSTSRGLLVALGVVWFLRPPIVFEDTPTLAYARRSGRDASADSLAQGPEGAAVAPSDDLAWRETQDFSANFWNVWQLSGTCPRLPANVHVTSLT